MCVLEPDLLAMLLRQGLIVACIIIKSRMRLNVLTNLVGCKFFIFQHSPGRRAFLPRRERRTRLDPKIDSGDSDFGCSILAAKTPQNDTGRYLDSGLEAFCPRTYLQVGAGLSLELFNSARERERGGLI